MGITLSTSGVFNDLPFAEGRFRRAYMGRYTGPPERDGQPCVVKNLKDTFTWNPSDWNTTLKIHSEAQDLAKCFNMHLKSLNVPGHVNFTNVEVQQVDRQTNPYRGPMINEYVIVEDYIPGQFIKWLNNYGYVCQEMPAAQAMPAFAHFSWCCTNGEKMIADLQGVRSENFMGATYTLTDPVLMSGTVDGGRYGCTDTGVEGIAMFFINHQCNDLCNMLPKPTLQELGIPQRQVDSGIQQLQQIMNATAYSHELKLPYDIRSRLVVPLKTIAQRYENYSCYPPASWGMPAIAQQRWCHNQYEMITNYPGGGMERRAMFAVNHQSNILPAPPFQAQGMQQWPVGPVFQQHSMNAMGFSHQIHVSMPYPPGM